MINFTMLCYTIMDSDILNEMKMYIILVMYEHALGLISHNILPPSNDMESQINLVQLNAKVKII